MPTCSPPASVSQLRGVQEQDLCCIQEESGELEKLLGVEREKSSRLQHDLAASLKESREALHREKDIMTQLEAQDQVQLHFPHSQCACCIWFVVCCSADSRLLAQNHNARTTAQKYRHLPFLIPLLVQRIGALSDGRPTSWLQQLVRHVWILCIAGRQQRLVCMCSYAGA